MVFSLLKCFQSKINALSMLNAFSRQIKSNFNANIAFVFAKGREREYFIDESERELNFTCIMHKQLICKWFNVLFLQQFNVLLLKYFVDIIVITVMSGKMHVHTYPVTPVINFHKLINNDLLAFNLFIFPRKYYLYQLNTHHCCCFFYFWVMDNILIKN